MESLTWFFPTLPIAATAVWQPVRRIWLCVSSVKTTPAKTELSLSNIDSAYFTKDVFDPSNDLKVSLRIKPQKVRFVRPMLLFTTKFSNANCETSTAGSSRHIANTNVGGRVRLFNYSTYPGTLNNGCQMLIIFSCSSLYITQRNPEMTGLWIV